MKKILLLGGIIGIAFAITNNTTFSSTSATNLPTGTYISYIGGSKTAFNTVNSITRSEAATNCRIDKNKNPGKSIRCTWPNKTIVKTTTNTNNSSGNGVSAQNTPGTTISSTSTSKLNLSLSKTTAKVGESVIFSYDIGSDYKACSLHISVGKTGWGTFGLNESNKIYDYYNGPKDPVGKKEFKIDQTYLRDTGKVVLLVDCYNAINQKNERKELVINTKTDTVIPPVCPVYSMVEPAAGCKYIDGQKDANGCSKPQLVCENTNTGTVVKGLYKGYLGGSTTPFITTQNISREEAYSNCKTNSTNNPAKSIRCTWNDIEILSYNLATTQTTNPELKGCTIFQYNDTVAGTAPNVAYLDCKKTCTTVANVSSCKWGTETFFTAGSTNTGGTIDNSLNLTINKTTAKVGESVTFNYDIGSAYKTCSLHISVGTTGWGTFGLNGSNRIYDFYNGPTSTTGTKTFTIDQSYLRSDGRVILLADCYNSVTQQSTKKELVISTKTETITPPVCPVYSLVEPGVGCTYTYTKNANGCDVPKLVCENTNTGTTQTPVNVPAVVTTRLYGVPAGANGYSTTRGIKIHGDYVFTPSSASNVSCQVWYSKNAANSLGDFITFVIENGGTNTSSKLIDTFDIDTSSVSPDANSMTIQSKCGGFVNGGYTTVIDRQVVALITRKPVIEYFRLVPNSNETIIEWSATDTSAELCTLKKSSPTGSVQFQVAYPAKHNYAEAKINTVGYSYQLSCPNKNGTTTSEIITIPGATTTTPPVVVNNSVPSISVDKTSAIAGSTVTFSWNANGGTQCYTSVNGNKTGDVSGGYGVIPVTNTPAGVYSATLSCSFDGSIRTSAPVRVTVTSPATVVSTATPSISVDKSVATAGSTVTFYWNANGGSQCYTSVNGNITGQVSGSSGNIPVANAPAGTYSATLSCSFDNSVRTSTSVRVVVN